MADHLDFIKIRGLETPGEEEVFQGLGGASLSVESGGTGGTIPGGSGGFDLEAYLESFSDSFTDILDFLNTQAIPEDQTPRSLGRSRNLGALVPIGGAIIKYVGGLQKFFGGAALALFINIVNHIGGIVVDELDFGSPRNQLQGINKHLEEIRDHLKKALIWEDGVLGIDKSILGTALLQLSEEEKSILQARLKELQLKVGDLALTDVTIQFGDDLKARIKGKALEF